MVVLVRGEGGGGGLRAGGIGFEGEGSKLGEGGVFCVG
jgi:hypothetical protein